MTCVSSQCAKRNLGNLVTGQIFRRMTFQFRVIEELFPITAFEEKVQYLWKDKYCFPGLKSIGNYHLFSVRKCS